ncbi:MAG TPA: hypothetical protein VFK06_09625 [Candidatus Angelobacter sp.]|nr:hypothetical protein [Candidatus Angelobacter sp.]
MKIHYYRILFMVALLGIAAVSQVKGAQSATTNVIEITKADLFANRSWNSTQVSVVGVRLGMTRDEVRKQLRSSGMDIVGTEPRPTAPCLSEGCDVLNSQHVYVGITITFDPANRVNAISVERIPSDAGLSVRKAAIVRRFKRLTYSFFNDYSSALRKRLFGSESLGSDPDIHRYDRLGIEVVISHSQWVPEKESDLSVTFTKPKAD